MALQPNEVKTEHIANDAVTTPKIADEQVTSAKIKNSAVTAEKLAAGAVTGSKLSDNAVTGSKIRDGTVRSEKIAPGAIITAKIGELQVTSSRLQDKAVTTEKIAGSAVTTEKIANGAVTPAKLSFTPPSVARPITPPITTDEIGALQVTSFKLQDGAVTKEKIADASVSPAKLEAINTPADTEVPSYDQATQKFKWVPLPAGGGVQMKTGTFTGDGNATQAITGVGFQPKFVIIMTHVGVGGTVQAAKTDQDGTYAQISKGAEMQWDEDIIISLDADGFTIGDFDPLNISGVVHTYIAFG